MQKPLLFSKLKKSVVRVKRRSNCLYIDVKKLLFRATQLLAVYHNKMFVSVTSRKNNEPP